VTTLDLSDIQGNILRGFHKRDARHFGLAVDGASAAARLLALMVSDDESKAPQVTTAAKWDARPRFCINIGLTAAGLRAIGVSESIVGLFPETFTRGPSHNAAGIGDKGNSAPEHWEVGGPNTDAVHVLISLFTDEERDPCLEEMSRRLTQLFQEHKLRVVWRRDGWTQPDDKVHFGYRDGIAQPRIAGQDRGMRPDMQPDADPGEFLLGNNYTNPFGGNYLGDIPREIGTNATYAAMRVLEQDVPAFEDFLSRAGSRFNLHPEVVAAKLMGRWRNGTPLTLAPQLTTDASGNPAQPTVDNGKLNKFDYAPTAGNPAYFDDADGMRCPIGSHIRRLNPRSALVMGKPHSRRIIRRGMSYGPVFDPTDPTSADKERGLIGYFICGDLELQFEFLLQVWANMDMSTAGIRGTSDPILGFQSPHGGQFVLRTEQRNDPVIFTSIPQLTWTRGSIYVFMPGIQGLKFLGSLG
jgi:deferrochelatase/peroxidase EfeB